MKRVHVVAAVIRGESVNRPGEVLIAKRPEHLHQGGKWEFPGGKVESEECAETALRRELLEEVNIQVAQADPLIQIQHDYPDKSVFLDVWEVQTFAGEPQGMEGQQIEWVAATQLAHYEFPEANVPIIQAAQLPDRYWITPECDQGLARLAAQIEQKLAQGIRLIQLRVKSASAETLVALAQSLLPLKLHYRPSLLINGDCWQLLRDSERWNEVAALFDGVHLTATQLAKGLHPNVGRGLVGASCHDPKELCLAAELGCHFATLSPIKATPSHPDQVPLLVDDVKAWLRYATLPVYGLGGLCDADIRAMRAIGLQGVAGIRQIGE